MSESRSTPLSTYRLQLSERFTFAHAAEQIPYIASLGISHVYLSPILAAAPGSMHGYDIVDHGHISEVLGGIDGLRALAEIAHRHTLGLVVDIVPNHMSLPTPSWHNQALWSTLAKGEQARTAHWFDIDWAYGCGQWFLPILNEPLSLALARQLVRVDTMNDDEFAAIGDLSDSTRVLRYRDQALPICSGSDHLPLHELLARQHYRLIEWHGAEEAPNYRRFFDINALPAIRMEDPDVLQHSHALIFRLIDEGIVDGLRIDHPDGLANPRTYLDAVAEATDHAWVVVEKILHPDESLPPDWACAGTTGYDAQWRVLACFIDPNGAEALSRLMMQLTDDSIGDLDALHSQAKQQIIDGALRGDVERLVDKLHALCQARHEAGTTEAHSHVSITSCVHALLVQAKRYRFYVQETHSMSEDARLAFETTVDRAGQALGHEHGQALCTVADLLCGKRTSAEKTTLEPSQHDVMVRFQQIQGAVLAKGVEDTSFYRWTHLSALNEVGGAPERFAIEPEELHAWASEQLRASPGGMTCLSTHDTKRSEDVRARMAVLSELPDLWTSHVLTMRRLAEAPAVPMLDGRIENLIWQTLAATWTGDGPLARERLSSYLRKAMREAKQHTSWLSPNGDYEQAVLRWLDDVLRNQAVLDCLSQWSTRTAIGVRANVLGMKLIQLMLPGVADVYQGSESVHVALVDPDNRRAVDFDAHARRLQSLDNNAHPQTLDEEKLWVTACALRTRQRHREAFVGPVAGYQPRNTSSRHAMALTRLGARKPRVIAVATRLALTLEQHGGWQTQTLPLPQGRWKDELTGHQYDSGEVTLAELLKVRPVALLTPMHRDL